MLTWFAVIAATGLVVRLVYLLQSRSHDPLFFAPQMDALYHHRWALAVAAGRSFIDDAFFRAPLYPYFLGALYRLLGPDPLSARLVQAVVGSASCGLVYLLARRLVAAWPGGRRAADWVPRTSGLALAGYPLAVYFVGELLIPTLLVFLVLLGLILVLRSRERDAQWWLPGLVLGLAALARPNVLAFTAAVAGWLALRYRRRCARPLVEFLGAVAVVIAPVTVRNLAVSGRFVPIAWQGGTNFYIGNNPESDGVTAVLPGTRASWWGGYNDVKRLAEEAAGHPLKGADIDRYWLGRGFDFWRRQPGRALALTARKAWLLLAGLEVSNNRDVYFFKRFSFLNALIFRTPVLKFPFGLVLPLAAAGVFAARRRWRELVPVYLFLGAYGLSFVVFFVSARFRMPMVPLFLILAAGGVAGLIRARGAERRLALGVALATFLAFNLDLAGPLRAPEDQSYLLVAKSRVEQGRVDEALAATQQALMIDSAANVLNVEATLLLQTRQPDRAEVAARAAVRREPANADCHGTLGNVLAASGRLDSALACFTRAVELDPYAVQGWNNLGNVALQRREFERARGYYERALGIDPAFVPARYHLGLVEYRLGRVEAAHERWREVLALDPGFEKARRALERLK